VCSKVSIVQSWDTRGGGGIMHETPSPPTPAWDSTSESPHLKGLKIMVRKIYPQDVILGPYFPPTVKIFSKKIAEYCVHWYSSPWGRWKTMFCDRIGSDRTAHQHKHVSIGSEMFSFQFYKWCDLACYVKISLDWKKLHNYKCFKGIISLGGQIYFVYGEGRT
jgi:hypothetical protein